MPKSILERAQELQRPAKEHAKITDEDVINLLMAYFAGEVSNGGLKSVMTEVGFNLKKSGPIPTLVSRIPHLVKLGKIKLVRVE